MHLALKFNSVLMKYNIKKTLATTCASIAFASMSLFQAGCQTYESLPKGNKPDHRGRGTSVSHHWVQPGSTQSQRVLPSAFNTASIAYNKPRYEPTRPATSTAQQAPQHTPSSASVKDDIMEDLFGDILEPLPSEPQTQFSSNSTPIEVQESMLTQVPTQTYIDYTVQRGDSLWLISKKTNTPLAELMAENNLNRQSILRVGQKLRIPSGISSGTVATASSSPLTPYIVRRGDTLSHIALRFGTTVNQLKSANHLTSNVIYVGQKLDIPAIGASQATPSVATASAPSLSSSEQTGNYPIYQVQSGDTLSDIAITAGMSVGDLMKMNNITDPRKLRAGQKLKITDEAATKLSSSGSGSSASRSFTNLTSGTATSSSTQESLATKAPTQASIVRSDYDDDLDALFGDDAFFDDDSIFDEEEEIQVIPIEEKSNS